MFPRKITAAGLALFGAGNLFNLFFGHYVTLIMQKADPQGSNLMNWLPQILSGALVVIGVVMWFWPKVRLWIWGPEVVQPPTLEIVNSVDYTGKTVRVDGKHFVNCTFKDCTVQYDGGHYQITNSHRQPGKIMFASSNRRIVNALPLMKFVGLMRDDAEGTHIVVTAGQLKAMNDE